MKKNVKLFIQSLPGPQSYCKCEKLCSPLEIEHVVPNALLRKHDNFGMSTSDPNNLYTCCKKMNRQKNTKLFGKDFVLDNEMSYHTGPLARACLHMLDAYELNIPRETVALWEILDQNHIPQDFEYERDDLIIEKTGRGNMYLEDRYN